MRGEKPAGGRGIANYLRNAENETKRLSAQLAPPSRARWTTLCRMRMKFRQPKPAHCLALEVELDQDRRIRANDPCIMSRFDLNHMRRFKSQGATVTVANADLTAREEADMRVHTKIRTDNGLHVS